MSVLFLICVTPPALECRSPTVDCGEVRAGPLLARTFHLVNVGSSPVSILDVKSSCGCLSPRLPRRDISPGETVELEMEVNTLSQPAGPHRWRLTVVHTGGEIPLEIRATLRRDIEVTPASIALTAPSRRAIPVTITDRRPRPLTVTGVTGSAPWLTGNVGPDRRSALLAVGDAPPGRHRASLILHTDDPDHAAVVVPVTVTAKPMIAVFPDRVSLADGPAVVRIADRRGRTVVVDRVEIDGPLHVRHASGPGPQASVTLRSDRPDVRGRVRVFVREPEATTVEIEIGD